MEPKTDSKIREVAIYHSTTEGTLKKARVSEKEIPRGLTPSLASSGLRGSAGAMPPAHGLKPKNLEESCNGKGL